ncbi:hypothetical protein ILYODFUR_010280 [Ilyodon furcidens]|uniref:Uncharacterized protein n=1 Tax=Ilyodon furcidens TaxID=33524 RepID=A0ABV0TUQ5_9TELE
MVIKAGIGTFGSVCKCKIPLGSKISISIKLVSKKNHKVVKHFQVDIQGYKSRFLLAQILLPHFPLPLNFPLYCLGTIGCEQPISLEITFGGLHSQWRLSFVFLSV